VFVYFGIRNGENELEKETQKISSVSAEILEQPLWDYDLEACKSSRNFRQRSACGAPDHPGNHWQSHL